MSLSSLSIACLLLGIGPILKDSFFPQWDTLGKKKRKKSIYFLFCKRLSIEDKFWVRDGDMHSFLLWVLGSPVVLVHAWHVHAAAVSFVFICLLILLFLGTVPWLSSISHILFATSYMAFPALRGGIWWIHPVLQGEMASVNKRSKDYIEYFTESR